MVYNVLKCCAVRFADADVWCTVCGLSIVYSVKMI